MEVHWLTWKETVSEVLVLYVVYILNLWEKGKVISFL